jgi:hypothetical protein
MKKKRIRHEDIEIGDIIQFHYDYNTSSTKLYQIVMVLAKASGYSMSKVSILYEERRDGGEGRKYSGVSEFGFSGYRAMYKLA